MQQAVCAAQRLQGVLEDLVTRRQQFGLETNESTTNINRSR
jgi:hypothetical protein